MMSYPLTFNNEQEHITHVKEHQKFYRDVLDLKETNEELELQRKKNEDMSELIGELSRQVRKFSEEKTKQDEELKKTKQTLEDTTRLEDLLKKKNGISVVHKGICDEKYVEIVMKEVASDNYIIDNSDETKKMDIRLIRKDGKFTIGIECKDKDKITKADIEKFRRDKVSNKFRRSIFISTTPIKNIVEKENQILINEDELFIVTNDHIFLAAVMKMYLVNIESEKDKVFAKNLVFDSIIDTYTTWQATKKHHVKLDQSFLRMLNLTPDFEKHIKGHLYLGTLTKFKSQKVPY